MTFNAWALDGYLKVFWRNAPVWQLWPQVLVLSVSRGHGWCAPSRSGGASCFAAATREPASP